MSQDAAVHGGDQGGTHGGTDAVGAVVHVHTLEHVDQTDEGTDHAEGRRDGGGAVVHRRGVLVASGGTLNVVLQDGADLIGVVGVHDQHDGLLEEWVVLLIGLLLQGEQTVFPGCLGQVHQLVDVVDGIELLGVEHNLEVLRDILQCAGRVAGRHNEEGTSDNDEDTGDVREVRQIPDGKGDRRRSSDLDLHDDAQDDGCDGAN